MDDINRSISQYVKEGKYYEDAKSWYLSTFIGPISEKAYLFVLMVIYLVVVAISGYYYSETKPADPIVSYLLFSEDISQTYSVIHTPTDNDTVDPQIRITEYILQRYIQIRESYNIKNIDNQREFVQNTTVANDFLQYSNMISINNPSSPQMIYQDLYEKTIDIKKIDLLKSKTSMNSQQAIVYFQSNLINLATNQVIPEDFVATINFKIDNIKALMEKDANKLQFLVLNYNLHKVDKK